MKKWLLLTIIGISVGFTSSTEAQNRRNRDIVNEDVVPFRNDFDFRYDFASDRHFDHQRSFFKRTSRQFLQTLRRGNLVQARLLKQAMIEEMLFEIRQTRQLLRQEKRFVNRRINQRRYRNNQRNRVYNRGYNRGLYSKRRIDRANLIYLERRLDAQLSILFDFENRRLNRSRQSQILHEQFVREFRRTLRG